MRVIAMVLLACALTACGQEAKEETPPAQEAQADLPYRVVAHRDAQITEADGQISVTRTTEREQGLLIQNVPGDTTPIRLSFNVSGSVERVSVYRASEWMDLDAAPSHSVRLGNGGAFNVMVVPTLGGTATVTITEATDCRRVPEGGCPLLRTPSELRQ